MTASHPETPKRTGAGALRATLRGGALALLVVAGTLVSVAPALASEAPAPRPHLGSAGPAQAATIYTVQPGHTLAAIAARFDTSVAVLAQSNRIANPDMIEVGQEIAIPSTSGGSDEPPAD